LKKVLHPVLRVLYLFQRNEISHPESEMNRPLTETQKGMLEALQAMPKRYRHFEQVGGWIRWEFAGTYDWRSLKGLMQRGLVEVSDHGFRPSEQ
jgi:hypothetical protein